MVKNTIKVTNDDYVMRVFPCNVLNAAYCRKTGSVLL